MNNNINGILKSIFGFKNEINVWNISEELEKKFEELSLKNENNNNNSMDTSEDNENNNNNNNDNNNNDNNNIKENEKYKDGRIGPDEVCLEGEYCFGNFLINNEILEIASLSNFSSFRANACVFEGKWMYEVILLSDGLQQIGWAPLAWTFTDEIGVGDVMDSYAYDGKRKKKWNIKDETFGPDWTRGDVIGVTIDLEKATISFYRNGIFIGVAYENIRTNVSGLAYFPALSISHGECSLLNFGKRPFEFPIEGYQPIHQSTKIYSKQLSQMNFSVKCLEELLQQVSKGIFKDSQEEVVVFASLFSQIGPLLSIDYAVVSYFVPLIEKLCVNNNLDQLVSLFKYSEIYLEEFEFTDLWKIIWFHLTLKCSITPIYNLEQKKYNGYWISIVKTLLSIPLYFEQFCSLKYFTSHLEKLFIIKSPNIDQDLHHLIPRVWWSDSDQFCTKEDKLDMEQSKNFLNFVLSEHEKNMFFITKLFIDNNKPFQRIIPGIEKDSTPRRLFLQWARSLIDKNKLLGSEFGQMSPTSNHFVLLNLYYIILMGLKDFFNNGVENFPCIIWNKLNYFEFSHLGGAISHIRKENVISEEESFNKSKDQFPCLVFESELDVNSNACLFDISLFLNNLIVFLKFKTIASLSNRAKKLQRSIKLFSDTLSYNEKSSFDTPNDNNNNSDNNNNQQNNSQPNNEDNQEKNNENIERKRKRSKDKEITKSDLEEKVATFRDILRATEWNLVCLLCSNRAERIMESLSFCSRLMNHVSINKSVFFPYIPQFYLDNVVYSFRILFEILYPRFIFDKDENRRRCMTDAVEFMTSHLLEKRIANPEVREILLQEMNTLCTFGSFVRAMERTKEGKEKLIPVILKFKKTNWIPMTNIFWKLWEGKGFGQEKFKFYEEISQKFQLNNNFIFPVDDEEDQFTLISDPELMKSRQLNRTSVVFHHLFVQFYQSSPLSFDKFLNKLFNTLNWCITEFTVSMFEYDKIKGKQLYGDDFQIIKKCLVMFELIIMQARLIEICSFECPSLFLQQKETNLTRLIELLITILSRVTSGKESKSLRLMLEDPNISAPPGIKIECLLCYIVGSMLSLYKFNLENKQQSSLDFCKIFGQQDSLTKEALNFLSEITLKTLIPNSETPISNYTTSLFQYYEEMIKKMIEFKESVKEEKLEEKNDEDDKLCPICCTFDMDRTFVPCGHQSCHRCVDRHLMNSKKCFFCNAEITSLTEF